MELILKKICKNADLKYCAINLLTVIYSQEEMKQIHEPGWIQQMQTYFMGQSLDPDKHVFLELLQWARMKLFSPGNICSSFYATGLVPYNPAIILKKLAGPTGPLKCVHECECR